MSLALLCPIARPVESTTRHRNAAVHRRDVAVWARTVSPLATSFRIHAAAGSLTPVGCSAVPRLSNMPASVSYLTTSHIAGVREQVPCQNKRPAASTARTRSTPLTPCFGVRNGCSERDQS